MHRIWVIGDVTITILQLLERSDQARMARVCRSLWDSAVPLVWEELYDITTFKTLLCIKEDGSDGLTTHTDQSTVSPHCERLCNNRLALYAQFVRKMVFVLNSTTHRVLKHLSNAPSFNGSLVKLRSLEVTVDLRDDICDGITLFRTFYTPILTRIRISVNSVNDQTLEELPQSLLQAVTTSALPALQSLAFLWQIINPFDPAYVDNVLRAHRQLHVVEIFMPEYSQRILETLKNLPALQTLKLNYFNSVLERSLLVSPTAARGFPCLVSLEVHSDLNTAQHLLTSIEPKQMKVLTISVYPTIPSFDYRMDVMLGCLSQFNELKEVELRLGIPIIWEHIEPVLSCQGITRFSLLSNRFDWIPVDRTHLDAMVQAWPYLSHLAVTHAYYQPFFGTPLIKLADLLQLTNTRPSIRTLCVSFDARRTGQEDVFTSMASPTKPISGSRCPLEVLDVGMSMRDPDTDAGDQLGQLFTSWWPTLRELKAATSGHDWDPVIDYVELRSRHGWGTALAME